MAAAAAGCGGGADRVSVVVASSIVCFSSTGRTSGILLVSIQGISCCSESAPSSSNQPYISPLIIPSLSPPPPTGCNIHVLIIPSSSSSLSTPSISLRFPSSLPAIISFWGARTLNACIIPNPPITTKRAMAAMVAAVF